MMLRRVRATHLAKCSHGALHAPYLRPGITLLEVIVSMVIFLASLTAIFQLVSIGSDRALDVQYLSKASMLCQSKLAELMIGAEPLQSVGGTSFPKANDDDLDWQYKIDANDSEINGLKNVRVTVKLERPDGKLIEVSLSRDMLAPSIRGSSLDKPATANSGSGGTSP